MRRGVESNPGARRRYPRRVRGRATTWAVAAGLAFGTAGVSIAASHTIHQPAQVGNAAHRMASAVGRTEPSTGDSARHAAPADAVHLLVELVNAERGRSGLPPLRLDPWVAIAAGAHADDMAATGVMRHVGSDGSDGGTRLGRAGYDWASWGENIGSGPSDPAAKVSAWLASPPHRANLLGDFTAVGIGVADAPDGTVYWSLLVTRPLGSS